MSSILSEQTITKFETSKKILLKIAIWTMVGGVVLGAVSILVGWDGDGAMIAKLMGTVLLLGLMLLISVNNFRRIASKEAAVQILAIIGLVTNILWATLWIIMIWVPELLTDCTDRDRFVTTCGPSILTKVAVCVSSLSCLGFFGSNVMSIFEGEKKSIIKPLKITCLICLVYECVYSVVMTIMEFRYSEWSQKFGMLSGFVGFAWVVLVIVALVISRSERRRLAVPRGNDSGNTTGKNVAPKSEAELRAEIEEKVRREMIEKEVREQFAREHNQNNQQ